MRWPSWALVAGARTGFGRLSARDRRALRLGLWLLLPPLLAVRVVKPWLAMLEDTRGQVARERDLLVRERRLVAATPALPGQIQRADSLLESVRGRLFAGPDPVAAAAALTRYVTEQAGAHRVLVQGSDTRDAIPLTAGLVRLTVEVRAIGDLRGLTEWLAALEEGSRSVSVTELRITPGPQSPEDEVEEEVLGIVLKASGLSLADSGLTTIAVGSP